MALCFLGFFNSLSIIFLFVLVFVLLTVTPSCFSFLDFLGVLSFIDLKYKAAPDYLLLIALFLSFFTTNSNLLDAFKNAFLFSGALVLLNFVITFYIQNIKAKILKDESLKTQEALGEGDIPIIAMMGVILGLSSGIFAIFLAAFFAIIPSIYSNIVKKDIQTPFIPYLVLGFYVEYFFNLETFIKAFYWN